MTHRILLCWELGGGLGHLYRLHAVARLLIDSGREVQFVVPDLKRAARVFNDLPMEIVQGPRWGLPSSDLPFSLNYAQNLIRNGLGGVKGLTSNLRCWQELFRAFQPDAVVLEHAPTALLAARVCEIPRFAIGTGFTVPPGVSPMPTIQPWFAPPLQRLADSEDELVQAMNASLRMAGGKPLENLASLFEDTRALICTFPELDHYEERPSGEYVGPVLSSAETALPLLPVKSEKEPFVFVYLNRQSRQLTQVLGHLRKRRIHTLAVVPDLEARNRREFSCETMTVLNRPVNLDGILKRSTFAITHGGTNTGSAFLLSGKPLLLLPSQLEQCLWSYRICERGFGEMLNPFKPDPQVVDRIDKLLEEVDCYPELNALSDKYSGLSLGGPAKRIAEEILSGLS